MSSSTDIRYINTIYTYMQILDNFFLACSETHMFTTKCTANIQNKPCDIVVRCVYEIQIKFLNEIITAYFGVRLHIISNIYENTHSHAGYHYSPEISGEYQFNRHLRLFVHEGLMVVYS